VIVATDAPLLPHQCARLAQRASLGIARMGGAGEDSSGDLLLAFAVGNRDPEATGNASVVPNEKLNSLFYAAIEATEQAIVNALLAAETMTGRGGTTVHALPHEALFDVMRRHGLDR
jgi:D-aminopeptidase